MNLTQHKDVTNKTITQRTIYINDIQIPFAKRTKYLGMTLDTKLRWKKAQQKLAISKSYGQFAAS